MSDKNISSDDAQPSTSSAILNSSPRSPYKLRWKRRSPRVPNIRLKRNKLSKERRDNINYLIEELRSLVPIFKNYKNKLSKIEILKLTSHYLQEHHNESKTCLKNDSAELNAVAVDTLVSLMNGFLFIISCEGIIVSVSSHVTQYLEYSEEDLIGQSIYNFVHTDDHQTLRCNILPKTVEQTPDLLSSEQRSFIVSMRKKIEKPVKYVKMHVDGHIRKANSAPVIPITTQQNSNGNNVASSSNNIFIGVFNPDSNIIEKKKNPQRRRKTKGYKNITITGNSFHRLPPKSGENVFVISRDQVQVADDSETVPTFVYKDPIIVDQNPMGERQIQENNDSHLPQTNEDLTVTTDIPHKQENVKAKGEATFNEENVPLSLPDAEAQQTNVSPQEGMPFCNYLDFLNEKSASLDDKIIEDYILNNFAMNQQALPELSEIDIGEACLTPEEINH